MDLSEAELCCEVTFIDFDCLEVVLLRLIVVASLMSNLTEDETNVRTKNLDLFTEVW